MMVCVKLAGDAVLSILVGSKYEAGDRTARFIGLTNASPEKGNVTDGLSWRWNNGSYSDVDLVKLFSTIDLLYKSMHFRYELWCVGIFVGYK